MEDQPNQHPLSPHGWGQQPISQTGTAVEQRPVAHQPVAPPPHSPSIAADIEEPNDASAPVVHVLSMRGLEYKFMTLLLWSAAAALAWLLLSLIDGENSFNALALPASILLVSMPGLAFFFLRLKRAELSSPSLRFDASKRRISQFSQFLAFLISFIYVVVLVYMVMQSIAGEEVGSLLKLFGSALVVLAITGGVFIYYWFDEHRSVR